MAAPVQSANICNTAVEATPETFSFNAVMQNAASFLELFCQEATGQTVAQPENPLPIFGPGIPQPVCSPHPRPSAKEIPRQSPQMMSIPLTLLPGLNALLPQPAPQTPLPPGGSSDLNASEQNVSVSSASIRVAISNQGSGPEVTFAAPSDSTGADMRPFVLPPSFISNRMPDAAATAMVSQQSSSDFEQATSRTQAASSSFSTGYGIQEVQMSNEQQNDVIALPNDPASAKADPLTSPAALTEAAGILDAIPQTQPNERNSAAELSRTPSADAVPQSGNDIDTPQLGAAVPASAILAQSPLENQASVTRAPQAPPDLLKRLGATLKVSQTSAAPIHTVPGPQLSSVPQQSTAAPTSAPAPQTTPSADQSPAVISYGSQPDQSPVSTPTTGLSNTAAGSTKKTASRTSQDKIQDDSTNATPQAATARANIASATLQSFDPVTANISPALSAIAAVSPDHGQNASTSPQSSRALPAPSGSASSRPASQDLQPASAETPIQLSHVVNRIAETEMRIGLNTSAFGNVEVRTIVHANDVGVAIGSEKGDLRSLLANEIPGIASNLQQQDLRLNHVNFHQGSAFSDGSPDQGGSNSRSFTPRSGKAQQAEDVSRELSTSDETKSGNLAGNISILV